MTHDAETETAAALIEDLLFLIPVEKRAAVLVTTTKAEAEERAKPEMICAA